MIMKELMNSLRSKFGLLLICVSVTGCSSHSYNIHDQCTPILSTISTISVPELKGNCHRDLRKLLQFYVIPVDTITKRFSRCVGGEYESYTSDASATNNK